MQKRLWQPIQDLFFAPADFFIELRYRREVGQALLFGVALLSLSWFARELWDAVWFEEGLFPADFVALLGGETLWETIPPPWSMLLETALYPALALALLTALTLLFHTMGYLCGGRGMKLAETLQLVAYAGGASGVLSLIPLTGDLLAMLAFLFFLYCGFHHTFHLPNGRAAAAVLLPYCALGLLVLLGAALLAGMLFFHLGTFLVPHLTYPRF